MRDFVFVQFDGFKDRLKKQNELEREMVKRFGRNKPNDFRFKMSVDDNFVVVEHVSERELINR